MATLSERDWGLIIERIRTGQCAVFLGAGASAGGPGGSGIPTASEIAEYLAVAATDPKDHYGGPQKYDLLRMAQYLESVEDRKFLCDKIIDKINNPKFAPGAVHRDLAALPFSFYLTTNFDTLMEKALEEQSLPKQVLKKRPNTACY